MSTPPIGQTATMGGDARSPVTAPLGARLRVLNAPATPAEYRLELGVASIGSSPGCDLVIQHATVSRSHVELELRPDGVGVRDLGSRNGTFYLGQRIEKAVLALGSQITLGKAVLAIEADHEALGRTPPYPEPEYEQMIGPSGKMRELFGRLSRLEGSLVSALIEGESGVGKELVAHALHARSSVGSGPFVIVNCGAIARDLVASELFGHRKGAFTGAIDHRRGAFESADGGTLFLDELGELPIELQPMLLRALEAGEVRPVGAEAARKVRVRVLAATNRDLSTEIARGTFREDLFYRLAAVRVMVPALRERIEDIEPIAQRFATDFGAGPLPSAIIERLRARSWPGNVRELRNAVHVYVALGELPQETSSGMRDDVLAAALEQYITTGVPYTDLKDALVERFTAVYLQRLLAETSGNQSEASRVSGLDRSYLRRLLARFGKLP